MLLHIGEPLSPAHSIQKGFKGNGMLEGIFKCPSCKGNLSYGITAGVSDSVLIGFQVGVKGGFCRTSSGTQALALEPPQLQPMIPMGIPAASWISLAKL